MKRAAAFPVVMAAMLFVMWLLLNNSLTLGHVVLGLLLAGFFARTSRDLRPLRPSFGRLRTAVVLIFVALGDIIRSNLVVARLVLGIGARDAVPGFMRMPLQMRDPHGLAILAMILTATPGTVWVDFDPVQGELTLHIVDLRDEAELVRMINQRYAQPLREIFE